MWLSYVTRSVSEVIERAETVGYGRAASEALAAAVARAKAGVGLAPVTVVVPSNFAGLTARRLLGGGLVGPGGIANVAFVTPFRLAQLLASDRLLDTRALTNPVLGAAVRLALAEEPGPFAAVADHHATEVALASLYAELSNVAPDQLARIEREGGEAGRVAVRLHAAIAAHLVGFHDEATVARAAASRSDLPAALEGYGHVIWYLPAPLTEPLTALVRAVLAAAPSQVIVGATGVEVADAAVYDTCTAAGVARPIDEPGPPPVGDRILSVTDADEEVRAVLREVLTLAEQGVRLDRIGIFHPTPDPYVGILQQQLAAAGIPANGPSRRRLADTVTGRTLLAALRLPAERWRRDRVMALVSGGPLRADDERAHPARWESLSREAGVVQDLGDWRRKLAAYRTSIQRRIDSSTGEGDRDATWFERRGWDLADAERLEAFITGLATAVGDVEHSEGWHAKAGAATALLHRLLGEGHRHQQWPEAQQVAFERIEEVLVRLAALGEIEPRPTHDVFVRALTAELDVDRGRSGRFGEGVVYGPLAGAAGHDLDAVFILGCAEGLWPTARRDDALLPDAVRTLADGQLQMRAAGLHDQHRALVAALAAAPPGARTLTFARGDLRGNRTALPSRWLLDTATALAGGERVYATDFGHLGAPVVDVVASYARGLASPPSVSLAERDLATLYRFHTAGGDPRHHPLAALVGRGFDLQAARRSGDFTEWDGNLGGHPIPSATDRSLSPTRLQSWAHCGFRYYLSFVLGLGDRDDPERVVELDPLDRGSGVHEVLELFLGEVIRSGGIEPDEPWSDEQRARMHEIAGEVFEELEARGRTGRPLLWQLGRAELHTMLDEFLDADEQYRADRGARPERVELPFGVADTAPVVLEMAEGRAVEFRGFADRVDRVGADHLVVSDYKTGKGSGYAGIDEDDPVRGGTLLQLGLYAEAAHQLLGAASTEAYYWVVDPRASYARFGYPWTDDRRARFVDVLTTIVEGIEAGVFPVEPGEWNTWRNTHQECMYCEFDGLCVRDRGEQHDAKVDAPALRRRDGLDWAVDA